MEAAFAIFFGVLIGAILLGVAVLVLAFLIIGVVSPIGALVSSISGHRGSPIRKARTTPPRIGRPVLHH